MVFLLILLFLTKFHTNEIFLFIFYTSKNEKGDNLKILIYRIPHFLSISSEFSVLMMIIRRKMYEIGRWTGKMTFPEHGFTEPSLKSWKMKIGDQR